MFGREEFEQLAPAVDGFSLMTYDYSSGARWGQRLEGSLKSLGKRRWQTTTIESTTLTQTVSWSMSFVIVSIGRARALLCPGSETVFSSLLPTLSGGKRFCLDSICTALILQVREQSQSWGGGKIKLWLPVKYCVHLVILHHRCLM